MNSYNILAVHLRLNPNNPLLLELQMTAQYLQSLKTYQPIPSMKWPRAGLKRSAYVTRTHSAVRPATTSATLTTPGASSWHVTSCLIWWPGTRSWPIMAPGSWSYPGCWFLSRCAEWSGAGAARGSVTWACRGMVRGEMSYRSVTRKYTHW